MIVKVSAKLGRDCEPGRDRQTNTRHFMEVRALTAKQRLHAAGAVCVAVAEVINVARGFRSFSASRHARLGFRSYPHALNSFSCAGFSFRNHDLEAQRSENGRTGQS